MSGVILASLLTELSAGRRPLWVQQSSTENPPTTVNSGVSCLVDGSGRSALVTGVKIKFRESVAERRAVVTPTYANGSAYSFALDGQTGTPVSYTAGVSDDEEAIVDGLIAALLAESNHNALLSGAKEGSGSSATLVLTSKSGQFDAFILAAISASGSGAIAIELEADSCSWHLWALPAGTRDNTSEPDDAYTEWARPALVDSVREAQFCDWAGYYDTISTGSVAALYVEILDVNGPSGEVTSGSGATISYTDPAVFIGPSGREEAEAGS